MLKPRIIFRISALLIFISFLRPIFSVWAYSDEYDFFEITPKLGAHMARDGNLVSSVIYDQISTNIVDSVNDLWRLRLLSFLCLFLIINHVSSQILRYNQSRSIQFLLPIGLTLPAAMTFISWSLIWQGSLGMLIGYFASFYWLKKRNGLRLLSVLLMSISILLVHIFLLL